MQESRARSLAKAVSWRVTATLDTFLISWLITGQALLAGTIAGTEVLTKIGLFYLHERAWARLAWGRARLRDGHRRSIAKAVSWRITGTLDTFVISLLVTGTLAMAGGIAATEVLTKIGLFYLHERAWARLGWGSGAAAQPHAEGATAGP